MDDDIDTFIRKQKQKLALEKQALQGSDEDGHQARPPRAAATHSSPRSNRNDTNGTSENKDSTISPASADDSFFNKFGSYEDKRRQMNEERKQDFQRVLAEQQSHQGTRRISKSPRASREETLLDDHPSARREKMEERNKEYNEYLKQLSEKTNSPVEPRPTREVAPSKKAPKARLPDDDANVGLEELKRKENELRDKRKRLEKELLRDLPGRRTPDSRRERRVDLQERGSQSTPRRGWATPTYEEVLDSKRKLEMLYRRANDPEYLGNEQFRGSDPELNSYARAPAAEHPSLRNDDRYLEYNDRMEKLRHARNRSHHRSRTPSPIRVSPPKRSEENSKPRVKSASPKSSDPTYATLPVGVEDERELKRQQQLQYRKELQEQMRERSAMRREEKNMDLRVAASGARDPEKAADRLKNLLPQDVNIYEKSPRVVQIKSPGRDAATDPPVPPEMFTSPPQQVIPYVPPQQVISPQTNNNASSPLLQAFGQVNNGYPVQRYAAPPQRPYIASSQMQDITDILSKQTINPNVGQPNLAPFAAPNPQTLPLNHEAYTYFANRDPLDPNSLMMQPPPHHREYQSQLNSYQATQLNLNNNQAFMPSSLMVGGDNGSSQSPITGLQQLYQGSAAANSPSDKQAKQRQYQIELQRQMQEQQLKKQKEKDEREKLDKKLEEEAKRYDPFQPKLGGGGAPITDPEGNVLADLRLMATATTTATVTSKSPRTPRFGDNVLSDPFDDNRETKAKNATERWKSELNKQIEEKKRDEERRRAEIAAQEEREEQRTRDQMEKIKAEYEEEQRIKREKEEAIREQNEKLREAAEAKRKAEEEERRKERGRHLEDLNLGERTFSSPPHPHAAGGTGPRSPPVPTLRKSNSVTPSSNSPGFGALLDDDPLSSSRPVSQPDRAKSTEIIKQLASMRMQLEKERQRVETSIKLDQSSLSEIESRRSSTIGALGENANAKTRLPLSSRLSQDSMTPRFASQDPTSADSLAERQRRLIRRQTDALVRLKDDAIREGSDEGFERPVSVKSAYDKLFSESDFIDVPASQRSSRARAGRSALLDDSQLIAHGSPAPIDDPFENLRTHASKDENLRSFLDSRARKDDDNISSFTVNIDLLNKKNQDRLHKLRHDEEPDNVSTRTYVTDGESALDKILKENRREGRITESPVSNATITNSNWLSPSPDNSLKT